MKSVLLNLLGELPYLLVLAACYIIMDRAMFRNRLTGLILDGWRGAMRRFFNRRVHLIPLRPSDPRKVLDTVAYDEGLAGHTGVLSPEPQNNEPERDSFTSAAVQNDKAESNPVVPPEDYDKVFSDSRLEVVPTPNDNEQWVVPVSADELNTGSDYDYPDDYDETGDAEYDEIEAAFGSVTDREHTRVERDLAERAIRNRQNTPLPAEAEGLKERIAEKIKTAVEESFADVHDTERSDGNFLDGYS